MLSKLIGLIPDGPNKDTGLLVGGMAALLTGNRLLGVNLFGRGLWHTEQRWRARHPEFDGTFKERWQLALDHYEQTHTDPINRGLHVVGIPMIAGGALGLLLSSPPRPLWFISATSFSVGWVLNLVGHAAFEKGAPAFSDDPLSFVAGPVWDLRQFKMTRRAVNLRPASSVMAATAQA
ncbi:MAG: DUF962 domain-containing protein [Myxococcales bacterium]|nr:DUF962 domain-containing protein [Myxococcales bacterium]